METAGPRPGRPQPSRPPETPEDYAALAATGPAVFRPYSADEDRVWRAEAAADARDELEARRRRMFVARVEAARPEVFAVRHVPDPAAVQYAARLADERVIPGEGVPLNCWLVGAVGAGKTWTAWEICLLAAGAGFGSDIAFVKDAEFQERCAPPDVDYKWLGGLAQCGLLVLDDLGAGRMSAWLQDRLLPVIDRRWEHRRPTVITTNDGDLKAMIGERAASRLTGGGIKRILFTGPDWRRA